MSIPGLGWVSKFSKPVFQQSPKTLAIPMDLHQSARQKVLFLLRSNVNISSGLALFQGGSQETQYDSDTEFPFRQDSWFNYLFGVKEPEFYAILSLSSGKTTLFMPKLPVEYLVWCGEIYPPEHFIKMYGVDDGESILFFKICLKLIDFF
jgi:Xaa-Pro dipeptidase